MRIIVCARALALVLVVACVSTAVDAQSIPQVSGSVSDANLVALRGNVRPEMTPRNDRGRVADSFALKGMKLVLRRSAPQQASLNKLIADLENSQSPSYRHWVTSDEFRSRFGIARSDLAQIEGWLTHHGFHIDGESSGGAIVGFSGNAGQVLEAFHTEIHNLDVRGEHHFANASPPKIPAAFAQAVVGVAMMSDFRPRSMHRLVKPKPNFTGDGGFMLEPADLATIYNFTPTFAAKTVGTGQTIEVVEDSDILSSDDWTQFRADAGLSKYVKGSLKIDHPIGGQTCDPPGIVGHDDDEAMLDIEWASAAAPNAKIVMAVCSDVFSAVANVVDARKPPPILSISFGDCETSFGSSGNSFIEDVLAQAEVEGISVFVSTGDQLNSVCDRGNPTATNGITVNGIASTTHAVAVGGTDFGDTFAGQNAVYWKNRNNKFLRSATSYIPEIPWNDSCGSQLLSIFFTGAGRTYGKAGFCNSSTAADDNFVDTDGGSGGPSACGTGDPDIGSLVVSGTCAAYAKPSWQILIGNPADGARDLPDVSLFAADGVWNHAYRFLNSNDGGYELAGGTSFAAPIMAGIQALIDQKMGGRQGNPNPELYKLAHKEYRDKGDAACNSTRGNAVSASCIFYDVRQGDNDEPCTGTVNCFDPSGANGVLSTSNTAYQPAFKTQVGWDFATGIGTVNVTNLVNAWK